MRACTPTCVPPKLDIAFKLKNVYPSICKCLLADNCRLGLACKHSEPVWTVLGTKKYHSGNLRRVEILYDVKALKNRLYLHAGDTMDATVSSTGCMTSVASLEIPLQVWSTTWLITLAVVLPIIAATKIRRTCLMLIGV